MSHTCYHHQQFALRRVSEEQDTPRGRSTDVKFSAKTQGNLTPVWGPPGRELVEIPVRKGRTTDTEEVTYKTRVNKKIPVSEETLAKVTVNRPSLFTKDKQDYSVAEFYHTFHHLPKVVMVTQSFHGNVFCQQIFNKNAILLLNTVANQTRVMAQCGHSRGQRMISLPEYFSAKLCVPDRGIHGQEMTLSEILKGHTLPISVLFSDDLSLQRSDGTTIVNASQQIRFLYTFGEINLLANIIKYDLSGDVELGPVTPIPLFLPNLRLAVVTGIADKPLRSCGSFNEQIRQRSFEYEYDTVYGRIDITEYAPETVKLRVPLSCLSPTAVCVVISRPKMAVKDQTRHHAQRRTDDIHYRETTSSNDRLCSEQASDEQRPPLPLRSANAKGPVKGSVSVNERNDLPRPPSQQKIVGFKSHTEADSVLTSVLQTESSEGLKIMHSKTENSAKVTGQHSSEQVLVPAAIFDRTTKDDKKSELPSLETNSDYLTPMFSADDVARLSISEVDKFLQKLNLGKYVREFRQHRVDGKLLVALDKEVFQEDFGMTGVEALRLYKFAKDGHVPK